MLDSLYLTQAIEKIGISTLYNQNYDKVSTKQILANLWIGDWGISFNFKTWGLRAGAAHSIQIEGLKEDENRFYVEHDI